MKKQDVMSRYRKETERERERVNTISNTKWTQSNFEVMREGKWGWGGAGHCS